jgi:flavodoxin
MKNRVLLALFCFVFLCIAGFAQANGQEAQHQSLPKAKVLVVYYSRTGHTQLVAERLAKKFNADLEQLIDQHKRTGVFGASSAGKDAIAGKATTLDLLKHNPGDYDIILIGGPSWFGNLTPAVRTFITQNDLSGKKIGLFGLCHLSGVEQAVGEAADLISKGKNEKFTTMPLRESELAEEILAKKIDAFYKSIQETK